MNRNVGEDDSKNSPLILLEKKNAGLRITFFVSLVLLFKLRFLPFLIPKKEKNNN